MRSFHRLGIPLLAVIDAGGMFSNCRIAIRVRSDGLRGNHRRKHVRP